MVVVGGETGSGRGAVSDENKQERRCLLLVLLSLNVPLYGENTVLTLLFRVSTGSFNIGWSSSVIDKRSNFLINESCVFSRVSSRESPLVRAASSLVEKSCSICLGTVVSVFASSIFFMCLSTSATDRSTAAWAALNSARRIKIDGSLRD